MMPAAFEVLREWHEKHPDPNVLAAIEDIEAACRDGERIDRFVSRRRIPASQRLRERVLVEQRLREYRACHSKVSRSSAGQWISRVLQLPPNRVRNYLEQIFAAERAASSLRHESLKVCESNSLTVDAGDAKVMQVNEETR